MGVVELPTGSKRVGLKRSYTCRKVGISCILQTGGGLARTVVVLEGRVFASTKASYVEISESSACQEVLNGEGVAFRRVLSHSEDGKVVLLLDEKPNSKSERAA